MICGTEEHCYGDLDRQARTLAAELASRGAGPGQRVALMATNSPHFTIAYFGALYTGAAVVTLNTLQTAEETAFQLSDCEATTFVLDAECAAAGLSAFAQVESCRELYLIGGDDSLEVDRAKRLDSILAAPTDFDIVPTMPDDTAVIMYTSGTTGKPKGAELTHFNLYYNAKYASERTLGNWPHEVEIWGPGHVALAALPLYHVFGQTNVQNGMLIGGGAISFIGRFSPAAATTAIARDQVTFFPGVPTMFFAILHDEQAGSADFSSLRSCVSGGAPLPTEVKNLFEERFGICIREGYGLTETSPLATVQAAETATKCGCVGQPIEGVEVRVVDEQDRDVPQGETGEVVIRGHNVMKGYYKRPEATAEAMRGGWFHSGDLAYFDEDGDLFIVDRKKDMILRGGYNVYPREVEEVLYRHSAVREAVVIGIPHEKYGEEVKAVISLKAGQQVTPEEVIQYCQQHVAAYKYPRVVEIMDELPKGPTGKLLKRSLRESAGMR